jgi:hypothetical protein
MIRFLAVPALLAVLPLTLPASVDPDLLALVPANTQTIAGLDAARARSSSFGQYLLSRANSEDEGLRKFIDETGFDPRHDLQSAIFASAGSHTKGSNDGVVLVRGYFDVPRIEAAARAKGAKIRNWSGVDAIVSNDSNDHGAVAFLRSNIAVLGNPAAVQSVLAGRTAPSVLDPNLQHQIDKVAADSDAWFVSLSMQPFLENHIDHDPPTSDGTGTHGNGSAHPAVPFDQAKVLRSITGSSAGVRFGDLIEVVFDAQTRSPQDATSLTDVVRFFSSMLQMQRGQDPRAGILASAFDNMSLNAAGNQVHLAFSLSEKDAEKLLSGGSKEVVSYNVHHR